MGSKITRYLCSRKRTMGYGVTVTQQILVLFFQVRILVAQRSGTGGVLVCIEIGLWCNGNTTDSGPVFPGSSPGSPTKKAFLMVGKAFFVAGGGQGFQGSRMMPQCGLWSEMCPVVPAFSRMMPVWSTSIAGLAKMKSILLRRSGGSCPKLW